MKFLVKDRRGTMRRAPTMGSGLMVKQLFTRLIVEKGYNPEAPWLDHIPLRSCGPNH